MGGSSSKDEGTFPYLRGSKDARDVSNKISHQLKKDFSHDNQTVKLLLLGAGQSGKSTIVKQMKLIHPLQDRSERGFTEKEKNEARVAVYANMVDAMLALLGTMPGTLSGGGGALPPHIQFVGATSESRLSNLRLWLSTLTKMLRKRTR